MQNTLPELLKHIKGKKNIPKILFRASSLQLICLEETEYANFNIIFIQRISNVYQSRLRVRLIYTLINIFNILLLTEPKASCSILIFYYYMRSVGQ